MKDTQDTYQTIESPSEGFFKDRGSKFIAYAFPVSGIEDIEQHQAALRKLHSKARHHCYAYRLGIDKNQFRANDDGEPSGTAGKPILGQIDSFELSNILIIIVRYFGGTLLGTGGLINAYKLAAEDAIKQATVIEKIITVSFLIQFDYGLMSPLMNAIKKLKLDITKQSFEETASLTIEIRKSEIQKTMLQLKAQILSVSTEQVDEETKIGGLSIQRQ